jgi:transposase
VAARFASAIRIDAMWLATEPTDMRAGADRLLAAVVQVFGAAHAHHGYLFGNARGTRIKLLVHDGFGVWCAARRLNQGRFQWPTAGCAGRAELTRQQFEAPVVGLPWQRLEQMQCITRV